MEQIDEVSLRQHLPLHLRERVRAVKVGQISSRPVVYWMRNTLRAHDNPALDVAVQAANALCVPLLVLLHVEDRYPYATARRQRFLLEGAQSVQAELKQRGLPSHVQVDRNGYRDAVHFGLACESSLLVAEEPFCVPWLAGVERLSRESFRAPLWLVDTASVVASSLVPPNACHRAGPYDNATRQLHAERITRSWRDEVLQSLEEPTAITAKLPASVDLIHADLDLLLRDMDVDMSVCPVSHTRGGSAAGYDRWTAWLSRGGLRTYAQRRNNSLDVHGVSRMSAYLNTGMVSPIRLAREVAITSGAGKSKFLFEFLTWRGLAYAHCYHFPMPATGATMTQLPAWAQETLRRHSADTRRVVPLEQLAKGHSGNPAWDGMQRYLVETGELHNNARMGWGKAIVSWCSSPEEALRALEGLNNRFALDGHAPPSYGGLLGCLGLFEGPGKAETRVLGRIGYRPPKPRYADLPSLVGELGASTPSSACPNDSLPASAMPIHSGSRTDKHEQTTTEQRKRRWTAKLRQDTRVCIIVE